MKPSIVLTLALAFVSLSLRSADLFAAPAPASTNSLQLLPAAVDLRPAFEKWGLGQRRQGKRGTCSVFTITGALEFAAAKQQQHGQRFSVEFLNWAGSQVIGRPKDGGFFSDLWKGFTAYGICLEKELPYRSEFDPALAPPAEVLAEAKAPLSLGLRHHWIKEWNVKTGLTDGHFQGIKNTLHNGWPVCGGFRWPKQPKWTESVLQMCSADEVFDGHSVLIVGYRDDASQPGGGVFLFRNTNNGGREGYMPYTYTRTYMNDAVWIESDAPKHPPGSAGGSAGETPPASESALPSIFRGSLGAIATPFVGRSHRISSNEQPDWNNANFDMTVLPPGKVLEMPVLKGPGVITHIWLTSHAGRVNELNALSLRIYWDGRKEPGVEVPLGEFFAVGQGRPAVVESLPVQVSPSGALSCYWRMPFASSARIVVANDNPDRTTGLYWQVDWVELDQLPPKTPYFHARYRQEYPAQAGRDYIIADLTGAGQYVGTLMSVTLGQDGWWGEGDDFFYIDGEAVPSLQGTGSEDYFNDAWGFRPRTSHWFGQPRWQGDEAGDSGVAYRWHVLDPVGFTNSLKVTLEHKGNRAEDYEGFYIERPDFINSVAFWYQTGEPKEFGQLPPYPERRVPWQYHHLVRAFREAQATGPAKPKVQFAGMFGARPVLGWANTKAGARLTVPIKIESAGRYAVRLTAGAAPDYGACDIELDGKTVLAHADFHAAEDEELDLQLGTHELVKGTHELSFHALAVESGHAKPLAVEMLRLLRLPPEATRAVKTHNEAHFIRLGIGRAIYAYRLAYGQLPDSLEPLVQAGLMSARYLSDENEKPLRCRREGDALVVESNGPEPWRHSWQGLDARR
jgi:hypothetical protein